MKGQEGENGKRGLGGPVAEVGNCVRGTLEVFLGSPEGAVVAALQTPEQESQAGEGLQQKGPLMGESRGSRKRQGNARSSWLASQCVSAPACQENVPVARRKALRTARSAHDEIDKGSAWSRNPIPSQTTAPLPCPRPPSTGLSRASQCCASKTTGRASARLGEIHPLLYAFDFLASRIVDCAGTGRAQGFATSRGGGCLER
ncbi:hypothetical protein MRX96_027558 [Rhipicephalus microplus]